MQVARRGNHTGGGSRRYEWRCGSQMGEEGVEDRRRIMRAGARLGMELHRAHVERLVPEALERAVEEAPVRDLDLAGRGAGGGHREAVVLARDEHPSGGDVEHRVVRAPMAEMELLDPEAEREPEELVPETDAEDREPAEKRAGDFDSRGDRFR